MIELPFDVIMYPPRDDADIQAGKRYYESEGGKKLLKRYADWIKDGWKPVSRVGTENQEMLFMDGRRIKMHDIYRTEAAWKGLECRFGDVVFEPEGDIATSSPRMLFVRRFGYQPIVRNQ